MATPSPIEDWLGEWEDWLAERPDASLEEFVRARCDSAPAAQVEAFRVRARRLAAINRRLGCGGHSDPVTTPPLTPSPAIAAGGEPVPGYRLEAKLGEGGFGEVWRATGPGGFPVALKFVRLGRSVGEAERRSLDAIRGVRHPHLLAVHGSWERDGWLVIATELADRTLEHRLTEARGQGHPGIPAGELHRYMADAAEALDHLNGAECFSSEAPRRVQHRDVKPQNLLLVGGSLKVGDYGLARVLDRTVASHTGSMTLAYAPPEFFNGQTSARSDQYSLAVTYCQLRGGRLPFTGDRHALMKAHLEAEPDLSMLPEGERPAARRALAKRPQDRWPSCRAFVEALRAPDAARTRHEPVPHPGRWGRVAAATGAILGVVVLALALAPFLRRSPQPDGEGHPVTPASSGGQGQHGEKTSLDRGVADTVLRYADRSYQGATWKKQTDAIALAALAPLKRDLGFNEVYLRGVLGWDNDDYRVIADDRLTGLVFRSRKGKWSFEARLDGAKYPTARLLARDRLALAPGYDRAESSLYLLSPDGTTRHGAIRGCRAILPVGDDAFYCACADHPLVKFAAGKRQDVRDSKADAAFVLREDGTPLRDYPVNGIVLSRAYADGRAFGVVAGAVPAPRLVEYREGKWTARAELPQGFKVADGWLCCAGGSPSCFVLVGKSGQVRLHHFDGRSIDSPVPAGPSAPDLACVWGVDSTKFRVMDRRGNVWERRGAEWHAAVKGMSFAKEDEPFVAAWANPSGRVIAVTARDVYALE